MSKLFSLLQHSTGYYNFDETLLESETTIPLGVNIPYARIYFFCFTMKTQLVSIADIDISMGILQTVGGSDPDLFVPANAISHFFVDMPAVEFNFMATPYQLLFPGVVTFTSGEKAITGGTIQFDIWYLQTDF